MQSAILMAVTMTTCSTELLTAKSILLISHLQHRDFHERFCKKALRAIGGFHRNYSKNWELY